MTLNELMIRYGPEEVRSFATRVTALDSDSQRVAYASLQFGRDGADVLAILKAEWKWIKSPAN